MSSFRKKWKKTVSDGDDPVSANQSSRNPDWHSDNGLGVKTTLYLSNDPYYCDVSFGTLPHILGTPCLDKLELEQIASVLARPQKLRHQELERRQLNQ